MTCNKKYNFSFLLLTLINLIVLFSNSYGQNDTLNLGYFEKLRIELEKDSSIHHIQLFQKYYKNGQIKIQEMYVKLKNDNGNRYWRIGKSYEYFRNQKLKTTSNTEIKSRILKDTSFVYNRKGIIKQMTIYDSKKSNGISEKIFTKVTRLSESYTLLPVNYTVVKYKKGKRFYDKLMVYVPELKRYFKIEDKTYDSDCNISTKQNYENELNQIKVRYQYERERKERLVNTRR